MRIISGTKRGITLNSPKGKDVRPTLDRYKEDIFNIININIVGSKFLDIFSGTGSIGIEALSRGASFVYFVDNNHDSVDIIKSNLKKIKLFENNHILQYDYREAIKKLQNEKFDYIYLDPPFNSNIEIEAIKLISQFDLLSQDGTIICESAKDLNLELVGELGFKIVREKEYKYCKFTFIKKELI